MNYDKYGIMAFSSLAVNQGVGRTVEFFDEAIREMEEGQVDEGLGIRRSFVNKAEPSQGYPSAMMNRAGMVSNEPPWPQSSRGKDYASVTVEQIQRLTKGCADNSLVTMVGPKEMIEPQQERVSSTRFWIGKSAVMIC